MDASLSETGALIRRSFDIGDGEPAADEAALLELLARRIAELLETQPDFLMSLLYRLDVLESKIRPVMQPGGEEPVSHALARLVLERQKQRVATKREAPIQPLEGMEEWEW